jgi:formylglycine-generating enzyme required for sulfatase activity
MARNSKRVTQVIGNGAYSFAACLGFCLVLIVWTADVALAANREKAEAEAAPQRDKVAVMVRLGQGRDEKRWFTPGAGKTESFQDCVDSACAIKGPEMVVVPKGHFLLGPPTNEQESDNVEKQHKVSIAKPFAIGKFAVTWGELDACMADGGCDNGPVEMDGGDEGWGKGKRSAVIVSWNDAKAYVKWLSEKTGKEYRLLSEAEWVYAASAGNTTRYWWGDEILKEQANYGSSLGKTVTVNKYQPNPWGLYQLYSNVWEWTEDVWHDDYNGTPTDGSAWTEGGNENFRVLRGDSEFTAPRDLRYAFRLPYIPQSRFYYIGLRIARTLHF